MEAKKHSSADAVLLLAKILILVTSLFGVLYASDQMAIFEMNLQKEGMIKGNVYDSPAFFYIANTFFAAGMIACLVLGIIFFIQKKPFRHFLFLWALGTVSYLPVLVRDLSYAFAQNNFVLFALLTSALSASIILYSLAASRFFKAKTKATLTTIGVVGLMALTVYFLVKTIDEDNVNPLGGSGGPLLWPLSLAFSITVFASSIFTSIYLWLIVTEKENAFLPRPLPSLTSEPNKTEAKKEGENKSEPSLPETKKSELQKPEEKKTEKTMDDGNDASI